MAYRPVLSGKIFDAFSGGVQGVSHSSNKRLPVIVPNLLEAYREGRVELHLRSRRDPHEYRLVIKARPSLSFHMEVTDPANNAEGGDDRTSGEWPIVLVDNSEGIERKQTVVPSIVRLEFFDPFLIPDGELCYFFTPANFSDIEVCFSGRADGERRTFCVCGSIPYGQNTGELVECRPYLVEDVSVVDSDVVRKGLVVSHLCDTPSCIGIFFGPHGVRFGFEEQFKFSEDEWELGFCPI